MSNDLHPEVRPVFRKDVAASLDESAKRITQPYFTKYEYTALVATRAQQIAEGAKPLVSLDGLRTSDSMFIWNVAKREIEQRKLPYVIRRPLPNNTAEYWSAQELEIMW
jgi:DNA-directed RNA polymerase I, II, and III subunit RPABC2